MWWIVIFNNHNKKKMRSMHERCLLDCLHGVGNINVHEVAKGCLGLVGIEGVLKDEEGYISRWNGVRGKILSGNLSY